MLCAMFESNWPRRVLKRKTFKCCQITFAVSLSSLHGKARPLHLNKFGPPKPKDAFCKVCLNWPSSSGKENF